jgi:hypothetical protein
MKLRHLVPLLLIAACVAVFAGVPALFPRGFVSGEAGAYEGLLFIPPQGPELAVFRSLASLRENEALRSKGRQKGAITCITPGNWAGGLAPALARAKRDHHGGGRSLWIRFTARPRTATGACMNHHGSRPGRSGSWGSYLEIIAIADAQPIPCDSVDFIVYRRRCPPQPRNPNRS